MGHRTADVLAAACLHDLRDQLGFQRARVVLHDADGHHRTAAVEPPGADDSARWSSTEGMTAAIRWKGDPLGQIDVERAQGATFSNADRASLAAAAEQLAQSLQDLSDGAIPGRSSILGAIGREIDRAALSGEPLVALVERIVEPIREVVGADRLAVLRYDLVRGQATRLATSRSYDASPEIPGPIPVSQLITPAFAAAPHELLMPDLRDVPASGPLGTKYMLEQGLTCGALLPLVFDGRIQGSLLLGGFEPVCLAPERLAVAREIAHRLAVAMAHADARERSDNAILRLELLRQIDASVLHLTGSERLADIAVDAFGRLAHAAWVMVAAFDAPLERGSVYGVWRDGEPIAFERGASYPLAGAMPDRWRTAPTPEPLPDLAAAAVRFPAATGAIDPDLTVGAMIPLIVDGRLVGAAMLAGEDPRLVEPETIEVAQEVANRLGVAFVQDRDRAGLERARLRLEALHELDRLILAEASVQEIAAASVRHLHALMRVARILVMAYDLDARTVELLAGGGDEPLPPDLPSGPIVVAGQLLHPEMLADLRTTVVTDPHARPPIDEIEAALRLDSVGAVAEVPVLVNEQLAGMVFLAAGSKAAFAHDALEVVEEVAGQLGVAMSAARIREANRLSMEAFALLHAIDRDTLSARPLLELAGDAAAALRSLTGAALVRLAGYDTEAGTATLLANVSDHPGPGEVGGVVPLARVVMPEMLAAPSPILFSPLDVAEQQLPNAAALRAMGYTAGAWIPMMAGEALVGALVVAAPKPWRLRGDLLDRVTEVASQLAVAVAADRAREATASNLARLDFVNRVSRSVLAADSVKEIAEAAATRLAGLPGAARVAVVEVVEGAGMVRFLADATLGSQPVMGRGASIPIRDVLPSHVVDDHQAVWLADMRDTAMADLPAGKAAIAAGYPTVAIVPLLAAGELVGALALGGSDPRLVEAQQRAVVGEVADQLAVALVHARARDAVEHALERQRLVHEIDTAILASASVEEIARRVVAPLVRLTRARRLDISAYDLDADRGRILAFAQEGDGPAAPVGTAFRLREVVPMVADAPPRLRVLRDMAAAVDEIGLVRTSVKLGYTAGAWVPLLADGRLIGAISLAGADDMLLDDVTVGVAQQVGDQLAVALQHQLDRDDVAERSARLAIVNQIGRGILEADGAEAVAAEAVRGLRELAGASRVLVYALDADDSARVLAFSSNGIGRQLQPGDHFPAADVIPEPVLVGHQPMLIDNMLEAPTPRLPGVQMAIDAGVRSSMVEPILAGETFLGCLIVSGGEERLASGVNRVATREVASLLAVALRHAEVQDELREALERQRLVHQIDRAILAEASFEALAQSVAEPLRRLAGAKRLDIGAYDLERDRGRILAFAHDGTAGTRPPVDEFPLRASVPLIDHVERGALVMRDLRELGGDMRPVQQAIAHGLFNTLWMPLVAGGQLLGGIGFAGDDGLRIDEVRHGLASEVGDQLAVALLHERDKTALASREARLRTIIDESPNGIVVLDDQGVIQLANPAAHAMFLADPGSLAGQPVTIFVPDASRAPTGDQVAAWFAAPAYGVTHPMDTEARRVDGSHIPVHVLLAPVETPEGRIAIATIIDLSERVQLEARLRQAERLETLGQFAGVLAHDVRNHLAAVTWSAELMAAELAPDSPHREDVEIIRTATRDAIAMTKSVLEYARPTGEATGACDVRTHVDGLARMLERVLGHEIGLELDLAPDLPKAGIDGTALTQVLVNLASNARDAMPEGGRFRIHASLHPGLTSGYESQIQSVPHVHLEVSDSGLGMDEATRQRAFEAFYTTKGAASERRGTGLGLSSVFLIVNRAGGAIRVASTPGEGTTFTVDLPIAGPARG